MQFDAQVISHRSKKNGRTLIDVCDSDLQCCTEDVENRKSLVKEAATRSVRTIFLSFSHSLSWKSVLPSTVQPLSALIVPAYDTHQ